MEQEEKYARAKKRVTEIKAFYTHVVTYVAVMILLFIIDMLTGPGLWFYWPLLGWGILIVSHAINLFGLKGFLGPDWEKKKIQEEMNKLDNE
jgi:O-antigen/teichoic acid export membrane protein